MSILWDVGLNDRSYINLLTLQNEQEPFNASFFVDHQSSFRLDWS